MPFFQTLCHAQKNYPRNISYMPAVIFSGIPLFWKKLLFSDSLLSLGLFNQLLAKGIKKGVHVFFPINHNINRLFF